MDSWFKYKFVNIFFWQHPTYVVSYHCNPVISLWEKSMAVNLKSAHVVDGQQSSFTWPRLDWVLKSTSNNILVWEAKLLFPSVLWRHISITKQQITIVQTQLICESRKQSPRKLQSSFIMESKIIWTLLYYIFIFKVRKVSGFNLDSSSPIIYEGPLQSKMFGYSLATHSYSGKQW